MTVDVAAATVIERPIEEVSAFAGDPSNAPAWCRSITSADWQTDPPITLGSRITLRGRVVTRPLVVTYDVVEYSPGSQVAMSTTGGPFPMRTTTTWRPLSERATHMVLRVHGEPQGAWKLLAPFVTFALRRSVGRDLDTLADLLERRSSR